MPEPYFEAVVRQQPGVAIVDLSGDINALAEAQINASFAEAIRGETGVVMLNFAQVDYINSTGIALIVNLLAQARRAGVRLVSFGLSEHYQEIFRITRLTEYIQVFPDEVAALAVVQSG